MHQVQNTPSQCPECLRIVIASGNSDWATAVQDHYEQKGHK